MNITANLQKRSPIFWVTTGFIFVVGIGAIDFFTGHEFSFSLFYLIPILWVTWFTGRKLGLVISLTCAIAWFIADLLAGGSYSRPIIGYWNAAVRLGFFAVVVLLLPTLKELWREKEMARTDYLTGVANRRFFFELLERELNRSQRYDYSFAIAYIDIDGFKSMNDQFGHKVGDEVLCVVANQIKKHLREMDTIARVGGDEFILLFPQVDLETSQTAVSRIRVALLDEMQRNHWPVTFSIGVLICSDAQTSTDELIKSADQLMYGVKKNGKNGVAYSAYAGKPTLG